MRTKVLTDSKLWKVKNFDFEVTTNEVDFVVEKVKKLNSLWIK